MLTMLNYYTIKPDRIEAFKDVAREINMLRRGQDDGCITVIVHQRCDNPCEFVVYEQWSDQASLDAFVAQVDRAFSHRGGVDAVFNDLIEETDGVLYDVVC